MKMRIPVLLFTLVIPQVAWAVSDTIKVMCVDDYLAYCSEYELDTPELTTCMKNAADKLSDGCRMALKDEGYNKEESESAPSILPVEEAPQKENDKALKVEQEPTQADETTKPKTSIKKATVTSLGKTKKSPSVKTSENKQGVKKQLPKTKTSMVSYPKWLEIPKATGSSMSVYGGF